MGTGVRPGPPPHPPSLLHINIHPLHPPFTPETDRNLNPLIFDNPSRIFGVRDPSRKVPLTRLAPDWQIFVRFRWIFVRFVTFSNFLYFLYFSATSPGVLCLDSAGSLAVPCLGSVCLALTSSKSGKGLDTTTAATQPPPAAEGGCCCF